MQVSTPRDYAMKSWAALDMTMRDLENMLWDRALHWMLVRSGKQIIVDKTPQNAAIWPRIPRVLGARATSTCAGIL